MSFQRMIAQTFSAMKASGWCRIPTIIIRDQPTLALNIVALNRSVTVIDDVASQFNFDGVHIPSMTIKFFRQDTPTAGNYTWSITAGFGVTAPLTIVAGKLTINYHIVRFVGAAALTVTGTDLTNVDVTVNNPHGSDILGPAGHGHNALGHTVSFPVLGAETWTVDIEMLPNNPAELKL